jgi:PhnB protein
MTSNATPTHAGLELAPYIFFYGRCEEALEFYKKIFGGTYEAVRNADTPMADSVDPAFRNKIMHANFTSPGVSFLASDGREAKPVDAEAGNVSLSLTATGVDEGRRLFEALSEGGTVVAPFDDAFWGGKFGAINDRFGTQWMVVAR